MKEEVSRMLADYFGGLAHPTRLQILALMEKRGPLCVCQIVEALGKEQSGVSRHLNALKACGILSNTTEGTKSIYSVKSKNIHKVIALARDTLYSSIKEEKDKLLATFK